MPQKKRLSVQDAEQDSIVRIQMRKRNFLVSLGTTLLVMHQLVKSVLLGMSVLFKIKPSGTFVQMEPIL